MKVQSDTAIAAAESMGLHRAGDLAVAMTGVLERNASKARLSGVMKAIAVRNEVYQYLVDHPEGATADEIAYSLKYSILTVRPRVSELRKMNKIVDSGSRRQNSSGRMAIAWKCP